MSRDQDPPRDPGLPPGYDEEDPYEGEDLSTYPEWWRRNVEEFREHGMRPYRPPRLADGTLSPPLLEDLEAEYGVDVRFRAVDPQEGGDWELVVGDDPVLAVDKYRHGDGYSVYEASPEAVRAAVSEAVEGD
ncbi:MAG: hypothetical protein ABEH47_01045 [Haloferacaceae archaeon]